MVPIPAGLVPRVGLYGRLQALSVVLPGALLLLEAWLSAVAPSEEDDVLRLATAQLADVADWVLVIALALTFVLAYAVGLLGRTFAWALVRSRDPAGIESEPGEAPLRPWWWTGPARILVPAPRRLTGPEIKELMVKEYGAAAVDGALRGHEGLQHAIELGEQGPARTYAKLWLLECHPQIAVAHHEFEINVFIAMMWPVVLAPLVLVLQLDWWREAPVAMALGVVVCTALALAGARMCAAHAQARRRDEGIDAFRHFCIGRWIDAEVTSPASRFPRDAS